MRHLLVSVPLVASLAGCAANPVTGRKEIHMISEGQEVQLGQQYYGPSRQSQGGDYVTDPRVTQYVQQVGNRLAAVADRPLPYEFVVLNSGELNAWALPGGKIAINRGLLAELQNEAELAAVLGHEIVHAAARHGAQQMDKGQLLQIGAAIATIGAAAYGGSELGQGRGTRRDRRRAAAAGEVRPGRRAQVRSLRHEIHEPRGLRPAGGGGGHEKAFLLFMDSCNICPECAGQRGACLKPRLARPTPEALAVDVFATVRALGYPIEVLARRDQPMNRYAFLLID